MGLSRESDNGRAIRGIKQVLGMVDQALVECIESPFTRVPLRINTSERNVDNRICFTLPLWPVNVKDQVA